MFGIGTPRLFAIDDKTQPHLLGATYGLAEKAQKLSQCQIDIRQQFLEASCAHVDLSGRKAFTTSNWQRIDPCLRCRATYAAMTLIRERSGTFTEGDKDVVKSRACSCAESILL
ncbi:hypothetical protein Slin15195_G129810 [Septoria linicola]|uniref:Uncharacterized protein n=1 Tax=Septoria linicola TaxID=215465 RepID=A0A9Q9B0V8_9PEZI|nr:hypothetical protein Slin15195_G129810 [Septoria linicola]